MSFNEMPTCCYCSKSNTHQNKENKVSMESQEYVLYWERLKAFAGHLDRIWWTGEAGQWCGNSTVPPQPQRTHASAEPSTTDSRSPKSSVLGASARLLKQKVTIFFARSMPSLLAGCVLRTPESPVALAPREPATSSLDADAMMRTSNLGSQSVRTSQPESRDKRCSIMKPQGAVQDAGPPSKPHLSNRRFIAVHPYYGVYGGYSVPKIYVWRGILRRRGCTAYTPISKYTGIYTPIPYTGINVYTGIGQPYSLSMKACASNKAMLCRFVTAKVWSSVTAVPSQQPYWLQHTKQPSERYHRFNVHAWSCDSCRF
jgi:hypothetical protein